MSEIIIDVVQIMPATNWYFDGYWEADYPSEWLPVVCFALVKTRTDHKGSIQFSGTTTRIIPLSPDYAFDITDLIGKELPKSIGVKFRPSTAAPAKAFFEEGF